jgi:hypothetical protein
MIYSPHGSTVGRRIHCGHPRHVGIGRGTSRVGCLPGPTQSSKGTLGSGQSFVLGRTDIKELYANWHWKQNSLYYNLSQKEFSRPLEG